MTKQTKRLRRAGKIVRVILKDEDCVNGQIVGPLFFETANGTRRQRPDLAPSTWYGERDARKIARKIGVELSIE